MSPDPRAFVLVALLALTAGCSGSDASGKATDTERGGASLSSTSVSAVLIATLTPEPALSEPGPTFTATDTPAPSATAPAPTETPVPATATPTPTSTATFTPSPTPAPTQTPTPTVTPTPIVIDGIALSREEQLLFAAHNQVRVERGIAPFRLDPVLMAIARQRAQTMAESGIFSHYAPNGDTVFDLLDGAGYAYDDATENIHYNNVALSSAVSFAMNEYQRSAAHHANIVKASFEHVGIGFVTSATGVHYVVVVFSD